MSETDEALLHAVRRGEGDAFDQLFLRYYQPIFRVAYRLVGEREQAEDLTQETFLTLYHHPPAADAASALFAWLCRVVLNRGMNALRGERRERERIERLEAPAAPPDPQQELLRSEERSGVRAVLTRLPERQRQLLVLRYAGLAYHEIAAIIGVAPGSVGTLLIRAERAFLAEYEQMEQHHAML
ncbi:MAG TPA: sigma-70 family RNA polymerase sigma factor [Roseiflexaceae bacterium]|mgnify:CR=1 FL=1|nr:sigma-70 family RNA polymerase sigma factor [Roseiflexaceae bacterium]